jgi:hypothetical protein
MFNFYKSTVFGLSLRCRPYNFVQNLSILWRVTVITLLEFFTGWPHVFFCAPSPNSLSCSRASDATIIHWSLTKTVTVFTSHLELAENYSNWTGFILARTELAADIPRFELCSNEKQILVLLLLRACFEVSAFQQFPHGANTPQYHEGKQHSKRNSD